MRRNLTAAQARVLLFVADYIESNEFPPSFREIADGLGSVSTNTVSGHMDALQNKGWIQRHRYRSRALRLVCTPPELERLRG